MGYGIRDCANGACGASVASTVLAFETTYCASATSARTTYPTTAAPTTTGIAGLPSCGQTCFSNMLAQYQTLVRDGLPAIRPLSATSALTREDARAAVCRLTISELVQFQDFADTGTAQMLRK